MSDSQGKIFATGAEIAVKAAHDAGAQMMYGYPITPGTEVFTGWIKNGYNYLQTEDEVAAGFAVAGAVMAGQKSFSATAGPGHVLMQDAITMAEGMRLPFVGIIAQRGGPSSGTVIYSQQEVMLACFGGNGDGHRLVYSPSNAQEIYLLTRQAFNDAWQYRFPAFVLSDGYALKTRSAIDLEKFKEIKNVESYPLVKEGENKHWRNIYTFEEELFEELENQKEDYEKMAKEVACAEEYEIDDAEILIIAHGIVGAAAKEAVQELRANGHKIGLWRPITLRPLDTVSLKKAQSKVKKIIFVESSYGQLQRLVREEMDFRDEIKIESYERPALGIEVEEIINKVLVELN